MGCHSRVTLTKLLLYGIELQKFYLGRKFTAQVLIFGLLDVSFSSLLIESLFFMEKAKLVKFSRFSNAWALLRKIIGKDLVVFQR